MHPSQDIPEFYQQIAAQHSTSKQSSAVQFMQQLTIDRIIKMWMCTLIANRTRVSPLVLLAFPIIQYEKPEYRFNKKEFMFNCYSNNQ